MLAHRAQDVSDDVLTLLEGDGKWIQPEQEEDGTPS